MRYFIFNIDLPERGWEMADMNNALRKLVMKKMVGAVLPGNSTVELKEFEVPEPGFGEVLVATRASTICGSDIRINTIFTNMKFTVMFPKNLKVTLSRN